MLLIIVLSLIALYCLIGKFYLSGPDMSEFDTPVGEIFDQHPDDAAANLKVASMLTSLRRDIKSLRSPIGGFKKAREFADNLSADLVTQSEFRQVVANGVPCEWTLAPGYDPARRILFLHGGAFILGSPRGHRLFTDQLSKLANAAVLAVDYRMLPENGRRKGINDVQQSYKWAIDNGPDGANKLDTLLLAGDSAGGNLALMLSAWSKTTARRPDGVIAFSPSTDATMSSPTVRSNLLSDKILGEGLGMMLKIPSIVRAWIGLFAARMNPANPLNSPLFGDLGNLPKTLIHASSSEILLGESIRYTNKAIAAGSDVTLQIWKDQLHDWHLFNLGTGSANSAWAEVISFIESVSNQQTSKNQSVEKST